MKAVTTRRALLFALALLSASAGRAYGDNDDDDDDNHHNRASRAVGQGLALPLAEILNKVRALLGGEMIGFEFKRKDGRLVYKLKVATPTGRLREVSVDAMTGDIVKSKED
jgi:uncharacterized membrane protein YkoI